MIFKEREVVEVWCWAVHGALNFDDLSLSLNIKAILKWILPLESVEKVVSKSECWKLFQLGLNYHTSQGYVIPIQLVKSYYCQQLEEFSSPFLNWFYVIPIPDPQGWGIDQFLTLKCKELVWCYTNSWPSGIGIT